MTEQGAVLFLNEEDGMRELVTGKPGVRIMWRNEDDALRDLTLDGWIIEGPFRMSPKSCASRSNAHASPIPLPFEPDRLPQATFPGADAMVWIAESGLGGFGFRTRLTSLL